MLPAANLPVTRRAAIAGTLAIAFVLKASGAGAASPPGERRLALYNPHTDERFQDAYWADGAYLPSSLTRINWLMRDFHRDAVAAIDQGLLDLLCAIDVRLRGPGPFTILSGYRTAATNRLLRRESRRVAAHSEHTLARAADIRIDRVPVKFIRLAALSLRGGGVGTYWREGFVHVDVGPVREW
jgi:uncharacterized protein YcbK (DUF882 family)